MRRRLVFWAMVPLYWPLELGLVPSSRRVMWVYVAVIRAVQFVLDALFWINRPTGCRGRRP